MFDLLTEAPLDHVIPALGSPEALEAYKYALSGMLITPQPGLLGMTFPLMSGPAAGAGGAAPMGGCSFRPTRWGGGGARAGGRACGGAGWAGRHPSAPRAG